MPLPVLRAAAVPAPAAAAAAGALRLPLTAASGARRGAPVRRRRPSPRREAQRRGAAQGETGMGAGLRKGLSVLGTGAPGEARRPETAVWEQKMRNEEMLLQETGEAPPPFAAGYLAWRKTRVGGAGAVPTGIDHPAYRRGVLAYSQGQWEDALGEFEECYDDGVGGGPVLLMQGKCLIDLHRFKEAMKVLQKCDTIHAGQKGLRDALEMAEWGDRLWSAHVEARKKEVMAIEEKKMRGEDVQEDMRQKPSEFLSNDLLDHFPLEEEQVAWLRQHLGEALDTVGVQWHEIKGRCVNAKRDIKKGEVIFKDVSVLFGPEFLSDKYDNSVWDPTRGVMDVPEEKAAASQGGYKHRLQKTPTFCSHCRKSLANEKPKDHSQCRKCGLVFCCRECHDEAYDNYHNVECSVLALDTARIYRDRLIHKGMGDILNRWLVILRCVAVSLQQSEQWPNDRPWFSFLSYREGEHKRMHIVKNKHTPEGYTDLATTGYGTMWLIQANQLLEYLHGEKWRESSDPPGELLCRQAERSYDMVFDKVKANIPRGGNILYPFFSLLNHSCIPNAIIDQSQDALIATEDIRANEEISISYVPKNLPTELKNLWIRNSPDHGWPCTCEYCTFRTIELHEQATLEGDTDGVKNLQARQKDLRDFKDPTSDWLPDGRRTARGIQQVNKEQEDKWEEFFAKYPVEYRENMQAERDAAEEEFAGMSPKQILEVYKNQKRKLDDMERLGLYKPSKDEKERIDFQMSQYNEICQQYEQFEEQMGTQMKTNPQLAALMSQRGASAPSQEA